jgi:transglutaminase-like putative cysteine protease
LYLRAVTYDVYTGHGWAQTPGGEREVQSQQLIFPEYTPEEPTAQNAFEVETVEIQIQRSTGRTLFSTGYPIGVRAPVLVVESGDQPFLGALKATTSIPSGSSYSLTAAMSRATIAELRAAGTDYPAEIEQFYLSTDRLTQQTSELAQQIAGSAQNPFDRATALARYLQGDDSFRYENSAPIPDDPNQDFVDFFLFDPDSDRVGFCEHYATTMVMLARSLGIPARMAVGFAPGERIDPAGAPADSVLWQVRERNAHAWAELYFPGYGWQTFEATKSIRPIVRQPGASLPPTGSGAPVPSFPSRFEPGDDGNVNTLPSSQPIPGGFRPGDDPPRGSPVGANVLLIVGLIVLLLGIAAWRWRRTRRALRFLAPGDRQWRRLALAADRAGVAQRPSETIYEYAGWLEDQLPARSPDIRAIADGKVWQSYSGHGISGDAIARMEAAWKRLQLPLVWLAIRRRVRGLLPSR